MSSELEIVDVDENGKIAIPHKVCEKIRIHPHDKLILGVSYLTLSAVKLPDSTTKLASDSHSQNQTSRGSISSGVNSIRTVPTNTKNDLESYIPIATDPMGTQKIRLRLRLWLHPTAKASGLSQRLLESLPLDPNAVKNNTLFLTKQKRSVFDLQRKEVVAGTLKKALIFERKIDKAGKKDMPVQ